MARAVSAAIVGGGFGGVAAAIALERAGMKEITILERGDRLGGVWRANTYPGAACDVPSHLYSYSFAPNPRWSRRFSPGPEIQAYLEGVARRFGVDKHVRFGADVQRASFDEQGGRWRLELAGGEELEAEILIAACGQLTRPAIPAIPGLEGFAGKIFHSAHWDHDHDLRGRRVAVIGTGASAIQFVPAIAPEVAALTVFQRSAPWTLPKPDVEYRERTKRLYERLPPLQLLWRGVWWGLLESLVPIFTRRPAWLGRMTTAPYKVISSLNRIAQLRGDPRLVAATRPDYPLGCKRVLITSDWYPALRAPNVELVTDPVREVLPDGVLTADGRRHPADTIILGTGFTATELLAPMEIHGREGRALKDFWARGAEAYLGMNVPGFPNLFLLYGPNTNHGTGSAIGLLEAQADYVADAARLLASGAAERLEVRREVHDAFQAELAGRLAESVWATCSSWYVTAEGRVTQNWPGTFREYLRRVKRVNPAEFHTRVPAPVTTGV
ncbi:MAG TPA: NAD(P)/FAD-dependent oxidoreductase [Solirubrobacteraceae bacterium]|nr:NAD(P)/FAD-dependent oxidoreductase [Solirubrobacteraceae bacterium]